MIAKALGGGIEAGRISAGMCMPLRAALDWLDVVLSSYAYYMKALLEPDPAATIWIFHYHW